MSEPLEDLKNTLLTLKAAGASGFEGLLRVVLTRLTGIPFRLAVSGLQGGMDGDSALQGYTVSFEAKRYSGQIQRGEVLTKIVDMARKNSAPDRLWILGATTEIGAQLATAVQEDGDRNAISTLVLDWTAAPLPLLAVAVVAADEAAIDFLISHCDPQPERSELVKTINAISAYPDFGSLLQKLQSLLNVPTLATARSVKANKEWRANSFGSGSIARERLGQALTVSSQPTLLPLRAALRNQVKKQLESDQDIILAGGEGHGKSWLAAQICWDYDGLALFASAELFEGVVPNELDRLFIELLIKQTGDVSDETVQKRWRHRLAAWQEHPPESPLLVVVDGINQRASFRWDKILNGIRQRLHSIKGRLIVTVRPQFWHRTVVPGLDFNPIRIDVSEWLPDERNQLLSHYGINLDWLDQATLDTLLNPRLLGVAVSTLPHQSPTAWKGLTRDRILMEHLRASQRENFEPETLAELTKRLSHHARDVLERVSASPEVPPQNFEADSTAVIETRFFRSLPGPGDTYELRSEGLTLALGYTLIDQLWKAQQDNLALGECMARLIEPIHAMDRTVDVIFSALMVCALDHVRFNEDIFAVLLDAFSHLQNVSDQRFEEFVEISKNQPVEFFKTLGAITLEGGRRLNQDWFTHAAFEIAGSEGGRATADASIHQWLRYYNRDAVEQTNRYPKHDNVEDLQRLQRKQEEIQEVLSSLSAFERSMLERMTEVSGNTSDLFALALYLLAGRPLAQFASGFVALGLGFALDRGGLSARNAFQQLTTFNRADPDEARDAFLQAIEPLRGSNTSTSGQWTVVRMLYATGSETAAVEAETIAKELRKKWPSWGVPMVGGWRQLSAADPDAIKPTDLNDGVELFRTINPNLVMQTMGQVAEDYDLRKLLPVVCRFDPEAAIEKVREILYGLLTRTAFPLRQLILNGVEYAPLVTRDLALRLMSRTTDRSVDIVGQVVEREQNFLRMFLFSYIAPHLTPLEQLACMSDPAFGGDHFLDVIPSLKPQTPEVLLSTLQSALDAGDGCAAYGALTAARYGGVSITSEWENLLLRCGELDSAAVRASSFELASRGELHMFRVAHVQSGWSALAEDIRVHEGWFGSLLLAEACARKELTIEELLKRICPATWFVAAERVGDEMNKPLAQAFMRRLQGAVTAVKTLELPAVNLTIALEDTPYPYLSIDETERSDSRFPRQKKLYEVFGIDEDFDETQDRLQEIFNIFSEKLKGTDAQLAVEYLTIDNIKLLARANPVILPQMLNILEHASHTDLVWLRNIGLIVANLASMDAPEKAVALFQRILDTQGITIQTLGDGLTLEHETVWSSSPSPKIEALWQRRLFQCTDDEMLAREVLAAERFGAIDFIRSFVEARVDSTSTLDQAYAFSVVGFLLRPGELLGVIDRHLSDSSLVGDAAKSAKAAYENFQWGEYWVSSMCSAQSVEEFWRCLMISKTCMDARVSVEPVVDSPWGHYLPLLRKIRMTAISEQNKNRKKTLLGRTAPEKIFISGACVNSIIEIT